MVEAFKKLNVDVACLGNHELDFGIERAKDLIERTEVPWIISNMKDLEGNPIAGCEEYKIVDRDGFKMGIMGFAERAWLDIVNVRVDTNKIEYKNYL